LGKALLIDPGLPETAPLSRFRSIFAARDGIYSPMARIRLADPDVQMIFLHPDSSYERLIARGENGTPFTEAENGKAFTTIPSIEEFATKNKIATIKVSSGQIFDRLDQIGRNIEADLSAFLSARDDSILRGPHASLTCVGSSDSVFVHRTARILPGVVLNTEGVPIVIDEGVQISPFSVLSGPLYVGPGARLDHVKIGGSVVGEGCRLGGEIETSILGDFTNKHHEGFVGHSLIGNWVNLGALTTTSDLKNNYGKIRLQILNATVETARIKFGAIIADCVKTAIWTMINTGSVLDAGCNVFGGTPPRYLRPFSWGLTGDTYETGRFLLDCRTIFARRNQVIPQILESLAAHTRLISEQAVVSLDAGRVGG